jgi:hypothetical protein
LAFGGGRLKPKNSRPSTDELLERSIACPWGFAKNIFVWLVSASHGERRQIMAIV